MVGFKTHGLSECLFLSHSYSVKLNVGRGVKLNLRWASNRVSTFIVVDVYLSDCRNFSARSKSSGVSMPMVSISLMPTLIL